MFLFQVENLNLNEVIEVFEDVEGILIEVYNDWLINKKEQEENKENKEEKEQKEENSQNIYYKTNDSLIQPILKLKYIKIGKQVYNVKECSKIKVKSVNNEELDISVVLRVLFRSCGYVLVQNNNNENNNNSNNNNESNNSNNSELIFYCPNHVVKDLCCNEHKVKGKVILIEPVESDENIIQNNCNNNNNHNNNHINNHINNVEIETSSNSSTLAITSLFPTNPSSHSSSPSLSNPNSPSDLNSNTSNTSLQEVNSICVIHDCQSCPFHTDITSTQLYETILQLVWKAMTGKNDKLSLQTLQKNISIKWNVIQSSILKKQQILKNKENFEKELQSLGASFLDPGSSPVGIHQNVVRILSENLSFCLGRSSSLNLNHVILLISNTNRDYIDVVRSIMHTSAKVMLIHSHLTWDEISKEYVPNVPSNYNNMVGLKMILPRHCVLGVWEEIFPEKKLLINNNNSKNNDNNNNDDNNNNNNDSSDKIEKIKNIKTEKLTSISPPTTNLSVSSSSTLLTLPSTTTTSSTSSSTTTTTLPLTKQQQNHQNPKIELSLQVSRSPRREDSYNRSNFHDNDDSRDSRDYNRKRSRTPSPPQRRVSSTTSSSLSSIEPPTDSPRNYGSLNCSWCIEYFGKDNLLPENAGHTTDKCWFHTKKKNTRENEYCRWCYEFYDKKCRHKIHNCWYLDCQWCLNNLNEKNFHHVKNCQKKKLAEEREREIQLERERTKKMKIEQETNKNKNRNRNINININGNKNDEAKEISKIKLNNNNNSNSNSNSNNNNDNSNSNSDSNNNDNNDICSWCLNNLDLKENHSVVNCKLKKWRGLSCLWCSLQIGVKLFHNLNDCPNRLERKQKQSNSNILHQIQVPSVILDQRKKKIEEELEKNQSNEKNEKLISLDPRLKYRKDDQINIHSPSSVLISPNFNSSTSTINLKTNSLVNNSLEINDLNLKSEILEEKNITACEWCWNTLRINNYHELSFCPNAPKPKRNEKPSINIDEIDVNYNENENEYEYNSFDQKGETEVEVEGNKIKRIEENSENIFDDEESYCLRCWDNIKSREYHSNENCPYAPKPKSNEKPIDFIIDDNINVTSSTLNKIGNQNKYDNKISMNIASNNPIQIATPKNNEKNVQNNSTTQQLQQLQQNKNNNQNSVTFDIVEAKTETNYCALCWEYYRQRKYHDHPNDCRASSKIKKKFKSYIK